MQGKERDSSFISMRNLFSETHGQSVSRPMDTLTEGLPQGATFPMREITSPLQLFYYEKAIEKGKFGELKCLEKNRELKGNVVALSKDEIGKPEKFTHLVLWEPPQGEPKYIRITKLQESPYAKENINAGYLNNRLGCEIRLTNESVTIGEKKSEKILEAYREFCKRKLIPDRICEQEVTPEIGSSENQYLPRLESAPELSTLPSKSKATQDYVPVCRLNIIGAEVLLKGEGDTWKATNLPEKIEGTLEKFEGWLVLNGKGGTKLRYPLEQAEMSDSSLANQLLNAAKNKPFMRFCREASVYEVSEEPQQARMRRSSSLKGLTSMSR